MKSRISFFNWAIFKKDITRFAPLWALYTVVLMVFVLPTLLTNSRYWPAAYELNGNIEGFSFFNAIYGLLAAQLLFGELFNSRLCNALHAMPATRMARFGSHLCAGLSFAFVPNFLLMLGFILKLEEFFYLAPLWLVAVNTQYLFFFAIGVFSAICVGSRLAMVMVYGIINFLELLVYWFVSSVFLPMMPGVVLNSDNLGYFCPLVYFLSNSDYFRISVIHNGTQRVCSFQGLGEMWWYLLILGIIAVAALVLSLVMYRRRKLESAGDFIAVKWIKPVFLVLYTAFVGAFFSLFSGLFYSFDWVMLLVGLLIGFFTGKMFLERTIRVFKKKNFLQLAILTVVALLAVGAVKLDVFGIVRYVPEPEEVEYVQLQYRGTKLYYEEQKKQIHQIHTAAVERQCDGDCGEAHCYFVMEYHLKNGRVVKRSYDICADMEEYHIAEKLRK